MQVDASSCGDLCLDCVDAPKVHRRPVWFLVRVRLEFSKEPPEGQEYFAPAASSGEHRPSSAALAVRGELQAELDFPTHWLEVHEIAIWFEVPPNRGLVSLRCTFNGCKKLLNGIVWNVGRIEIESSAVNAQLERQPPVGGRLVLEVNDRHIGDRCGTQNGQMPASRASLPIASGVQRILPALPGRSPSRHDPSRRTTCA